MGTLLGGSEKNLFDSFTTEVLTLAGVEDCTLWHFVAKPDGVSGTIDCLYGEPAPGSKHYVPYKIKGFFEEYTQTANPTDHGLEYVYDGRMWFGRKVLELAKVPEDFHGDRVQVGNIVQIFRRGRYIYLEIKNAERKGWINDSQEFTQYVCDVIRTDTFTPERKIAGGT